MGVESDEVREALARIHPLRSRILRRVEHQAVSAGRLAEELGVSRSAIEDQLRRLLELGCVARRSDWHPDGVDRFRARRRREPVATDWIRPLTRIVARLDSAASAPLAERLELVAEGMVRALDAAAWSVSFVPRDGAVLRTVRGIESRLQPRSGQREITLAGDDAYPLDAYPQTRWALSRRQAFLALREAADHDAAERSVLEALDYRAVLAAGVRDSAGAYLLEIYADERTPERFGATLPLVRVLTTQAASTAG